LCKHNLQEPLTHKAPKHVKESILDPKNNLLH
jgi:hypothetical protein